MKKATILITIISLVISALTIFVYKMANDNYAGIYKSRDVNDYLSDENKSFENVLKDPYNDIKYHYSRLDIDKRNYNSINECLKAFFKEDYLESTNYCEEKIIDEILNNQGEKRVFKSIIGHMLIYSKDNVTLKYNYIENLRSASNNKTSLTKKTIWTYVNRFRDSKKLQDFFEENKAYFFNYIPKIIYYRVYKKEINTLIESYEEINKQEDKISFYQNIYAKAERLNKQKEYNKYTFWKRRELEHNDQAIYTILKEIDTHYTNQYKQKK